MSIRKHIPNAITSMNLLSGCFATIFAINGNYQAAFLFILAAGIFDFCDGFAARLLKAYSPLGKELDSLADMVSFGVAPAMLFFSFMQSISAGVIVFIPLLIAVFSGLRLAKFNIDTRQSENFIGMSTPPCAFLCGSLLYVLSVYFNIAEFFADHIYIIPVLSVILSFLLISEIPMFSFKFKNLTWKDNTSRFIFLGIIAALGITVLATGLNWSVWILFIFISYLIMNLGIFFFGKKAAVPTN